VVCEYEGEGGERRKRGVRRKWVGKKRKRGEGKRRI
jgi:hypothetical protein